MGFYRRLLEILWIEHLSNEQVLEKKIRNTKATAAHNPKETAEISDKHEERRPRNFNTRRI